MDKLDVKILKGAEAKVFASQIGYLRMELFKEFPYLYEGNIEGEFEYLSIYFNSPNSVIILFFDQDTLVGFSSSIPLSEEYDAIKQPFIDNKLDLNNYLYVGEIMITEGYRSFQKICDIMKIHNQVAMNYSKSYLTAVTVERPEDHPAKPAGYKDSEKLWEYLKWRKSNNLTAKISWARSDLGREDENILSYWIRPMLIPQSM